MTTQKIEEIPTMSAAEYVVEVFKRTNRMTDAGQWERADAIFGAVERERSAASSRGEDVYVGNPNVPNSNGNYKIIEKLASELHRSEIPEDLAINTLGSYRRVAEVWPEEDRFKQASYEAHVELASKTYDRNRVKIMQRLVSRSSRGIVTRADVRTYKSEMKPKVSTPWEERFRQAIWPALFTREVRPQAPGEYDTAISILEEALDELRKKAGLS